jgi:hypothetical protein
MNIGYKHYSKFILFFLKAALLNSLLKKQDKFGRNWCKKINITKHSFLVHIEAIPHSSPISSTVLDLETV